MARYRFVVFLVGGERGDFGGGKKNLTTHTLAYKAIKSMVFIYITSFIYICIYMGVVLAERVLGRSV